MNQPIDIPSELIDLLRSARHVAVLTGAGTSAESGVPTFREAQTGLWAKYDPQELATPEAFRADPKLVWDWYAWRRDLVSRAAPNPGHYALAQLEARLPRLSLITQNVDGMHQRAGNSSAIELHGNIRRVICSRDRRVVESWPESDHVPRCPDCNAYLRPDVVWFGESLPPAAIHAASEAAAACDLFLSVGTSAVVYPAASLPYVAMEQGTPVAEINPNPTPLTDRALFYLPGPSGEVLPQLVAAL